MLPENIALILYVMLGAIVGMLYAIRRVLVLERKIVAMEENQISRDKKIVELLKKRRR